MSAVTSREDHKPTGLTGLLSKTLTGGGIAAVMLAAILIGLEIGLGIVVAIISMIAVSELYALTWRERRLSHESFGVVAAGVLPLAAALGGQSGLLITLTAVVFLTLTWHVLFRQVRLFDTSMALFGVLYVGYLLAHFVLIRQFDSGVLFALATLLSVWANDVFAYLVGSTIGRHKMTPTISPSKSWEGFVAGTIFTVLVWVAITYVAKATLSLLASVGIGFAISLAAVVGDLVESRLKREAGVKDSGSFLPGHGGVLDRFDSLIMVSVVAYYLLRWAGVQ